MATKTINIDFYKVRLPPTWPRLESIIQSVFLIEDYGQRVVHINRVPIRLDQLSEQDNILQGEMRRIRMDELPDKVKLTEEAEPIDMDDDEGLGEATAFLYDPSIEVLVIQKTRSGISAPAFCKYFGHFSEQEGNMSLSIILEPDALQKLNGLGIIRRLDLTVAGLSNTEIFNDLERSAEEIAHLTDTFQAPVINLGFSVKHERSRSLSITNTIDAVMGLLRLDRTQEDVEVEKISVTGLEDEDSSITVVDLVGKTMRARKTVTILNRRLPYERRKHAVKLAWEERRNDLVSMFGHPEG